jgi:hypothetical protein
MSTLQKLYMIECSSHDQTTYFSRGIHLCTLSFETYSSVKLLRYTWLGKKIFVFDLMPAFCHFQRGLKARARFVRNPRVVRSRELTGVMHLPQLTLPNRPRLGSLSPWPFA